MAHKCQISGTAGQFGHRVSHAKNKTKHLFMANLQTKRIYIPEEKKICARQGNHQGIENH